MTVTADPVPGGNPGTGGNPVTDTPGRRAAGMRRLRIAHGYGLAWLGAIMGRDKATLSRWENEQRPPPPAWIIALAFDTTIDDVLAPCGHCNYTPPAGYQCLTCGTKGKP